MVGNGFVCFKTGPVARCYKQSNESSASVGGWNFLDQVGDYHSEFNGPQQITTFVNFVVCKYNMTVLADFY
jgi:hypothetical protein